MHQLSLPLKLIISIFTGAIIGLERESLYEKKHNRDFDKGQLGGVRTFSLISLLGAISGLLSLNGSSNLFLIIAICFCFLIGAYYIVGSLLTKSTGLTTELSAVYAFLLGYFITAEVFPIQLIIALTVIIALILSLRRKTRTFALGIKATELNAFISFALIALVILPFLPNKSFYLTDIPFVRGLLETYQIQLRILELLEIINPFRLWFIVALIAGVDVLGYILGKLAGQKKGWLIASFVGGFISSTSTTQSLAQKSKKDPRINHLVAAAVFANLASFLQIFVLVAPLNSRWLITITPVLLLIIISSLSAGFFYLLKEQKNDHHQELEPQTKELEEEKIFSLAPAIKFALLLIIIRSVTKLALAFFGQAGFMVSSIVASFSGIDAIVINLAESAGKDITLKTALLTFVFVNAANLLSKVGYTLLQGKKSFALKFLSAALVVIVSSLIGYFLI